MSDFIRRSKRKRTAAATGNGPFPSKPSTWDFGEGGKRSNCFIHFASTDPTLLCVTSNVRLSRYLLAGAGLFSAVISPKRYGGRTPATARSPDRLHYVVMSSPIPPINVRFWDKSDIKF